MTEQAKLRCAGLTKGYGDVIALRATNLEMPSGEFLTLLGPSGSGKTTLLTIIAGIIQADAGELWIDGKLATNLPSYRRDIGMVFQSYALFPHMTVFENIAFPLRMRKLAESQIKKSVEGALDLIRLGAMGNRYPRELSGGQQQRIALARCFVYEPSIILMDEPLGALDKKLRDQMQFEIKRLQKSLNATVLYVTHDQDEAMAMSDRICLMNQGGMEQIGTPNDLYFRPVSLFAADFLGESNLLGARVVSTGPNLGLEVAGRTLAAPAPTASPPMGAQVTLMIRPEHVRVSPPADDKLSGVIETSTMLGSVVRTTVRTDQGLLLTAKSLTETEARFSPGDRIGVSWPEQSATVIAEVKAQASQVP